MPEGVRLFCDESFRGDCNKEDTDLESFVGWWRYNNQENKNLLFHPVNEGINTIQGRVKMKAKGALFGLPDVFVLIPMSGYLGFICELKRKNPAKSLASKSDKAHFETQKQILHDMSKQGFFCCAAFGYEQIKNSWNFYESGNK
jgi:hypothetical protein